MAPSLASMILTSSQSALAATVLWLPVLQPISALRSPFQGSGKLIRVMQQRKSKTSSASRRDGSRRSKKGKRKISKRLWILIGGIVGIVVIVIVSTWVLLRRHFKSNAPAEKDAVNLALPKDSGHLKVSIKEVYPATNNLDVSNFIGQGTAGKVYKGVLSSDQHVAVKQITDEVYVETFFRELRSLSQVRHPNLVALLGYCEHKDQCFLLYELFPNGNLSEWLFGILLSTFCSPRAPNDLDTRLLRAMITNGLIEPKGRD